MNETVIVTGAAGGIGAATVEKYLQDSNFYILAIDSNAEKLAETVAGYSLEDQQRVSQVAVDLTDYDAVTRILLPCIVERELINHVVISHAIGIENDITENEKWNRVLDVNLHATQRLLSLLSDVISDGGRVVVVSSVLGRAGKAANTAYVTSKHALLGLMKALAMDWAARKITVNAVLPCWVDTPMLRSELEPQAALLGLPVKQLLRQIKKRIPLRELIRADDVADTVMFLTSPAARMITAQSIVVDGGYVCGA